MKSKSTLAGVVLALVMLSGSLKLQADEPANPAIGGAAYYPASLLNDILNRAGCAGVRFYSAESGTMGESLLAVAISGGSDMPVEGKGFTKYQLFDGIDGRTALISGLDLATARGAVSNVPDAFAADIPAREISDLLSVEGATGIRLVESTSPNGERTLTAYSANIVDGEPVNTSNAAAFAVSSPCPSACGSDPSSQYLVDLSH